MSYYGEQENPFEDPDGNGGRFTRCGHEVDYMEDGMCSLCIEYRDEPDEELDGCDVDPEGE